MRAAISWIASAIPLPKWPRKTYASMTSPASRNVCRLRRQAREANWKHDGPPTLDECRTCCFSLQAAPELTLADVDKLLPASSG